jgi:hypothetical protein
MNQNWEDEKIKQLFNGLKQEDEQKLPSFARVMAKAREDVLSKNNKSARNWLFLKLAFASLLLILFGGSLAITLKHLITKPITSVNIAKDITYNNSVIQSISTPYSMASKESSNDSKSLEENIPKLPTKSSNKKQLKVRKGNLQSKALEIPILISGWRTPTDFLLKTPLQSIDDQLLKTTPKLKILSIEAQSIISDTNN